MSEPARGSDGKFRRDLAHVERDSEACRLHAMGWSYSRIASELGYAQKGDAWRAVKRTLIETANREGAETLRQMMLAECEELRRRMWEKIANPPPLVDRVGRIVRDANGDQIDDVQAMAAAAAAISRTQDRVAKLKGLDAVKKTATMNLNSADINGLIELAKAEVDRMGTERAADSHTVSLIAAEIEPPDDNMDQPPAA